MRRRLSALFRKGGRRPKSSAIATHAQSESQVRCFYSLFWPYNHFYFPIRSVFGDRGEAAATGRHDGQRDQEPWFLPRTRVLAPQLVWCARLFNWPSKFGNKLNSTLCYRHKPDKLLARFRARYHMQYFSWFQIRPFCQSYAWWDAPGSTTHSSNPKTNLRPFTHRVSLSGKVRTAATTTYHQYFKVKEPTFSVFFFFFTISVKASNNGFHSQTIHNLSGFLYHIKNGSSWMLLLHSQTCLNN